MSGSYQVVVIPIWIFGYIVKWVNGLFSQLLTYNCARVFQGSYLIGNGMGAGVPVGCSYDVIKGDVAVKKLKPLLVHNGDHDGTVSRLRAFVLCPRSDTALV